MREAIRKRRLHVARESPPDRRHPAAGGRNRRTSRSTKRSGCAAGIGLRVDELELLAAREGERSVGLGAHAQVIDAGRGQAACRWSRRRPRSRAHAARRRQRRRAAAAARRPCRRRADVRRARDRRRRPASARARHRRGRQRRRSAPPSGPTPTKSVSQNWQTASCRSSSRPVQRLQPLKRQKTAGRPAFRPSPCSV